jgi:HSP20 family protein
MLMRSEPFRELDRITHEILSERLARSIPVDACRRGNELKIHLDLPGVDPRFIEVTVEKDVLAVRATRIWVQAEDDVIQMTERAQGDFSRQLFLSESLERDQITANYDNGVLILTIPVAEDAKPRRVEIGHTGVDVQAVAPASVANQGTSSSARRGGPRRGAGSSRTASSYPVVVHQGPGRR